MGLLRAPSENLRTARRFQDIRVFRKSIPRSAVSGPVDSAAIHASFWGSGTHETSEKLRTLTSSATPKSRLEDALAYESTARSYFVASGKGGRSFAGFPTVAVSRTGGISLTSDKHGAGILLFVDPQPEVRNFGPAIEFSDFTHLEFFSITSHALNRPHPPGWRVR
jgi:hypothetical protein